MSTLSSLLAPQLVFMITYGLASDDEVSIMTYIFFYGLLDTWTELLEVPFHYLTYDSKVHEANMGPFWGRQDLGGPHVGPMNLVICDLQSKFKEQIT